MLDARGHVLLTDFGLAGLADQIEGAKIRSGTPAYMAPEQLAGKEVTVRSDIYSLGLVLYEIFTGKRPFEAETLAEAGAGPFRYYADESLKFGKGSGSGGRARHPALPGPGSLSPAAWRSGSSGRPARRRSARRRPGRGRNTVAANGGCRG